MGEWGRKVLGMWLTIYGSKQPRIDAVFGRIWPLIENRRKKPQGEAETSGCGERDCKIGNHGKMRGAGIAAEAVADNRDAGAHKHMIDRQAYKRNP